MEERAQKANTGTAGFSLLEAVVAMVILAASLMAIDQLMLGTIDGAERVAANAEAAHVKASTLSALAVINPMTRPEGRLELGRYLVTWTSRPAEVPREQAGFPQGMGLYRIGLFDMAIRIDRIDGPNVDSFAVKRLGFLRVRDPGADKWINYAQPNDSQSK